MRKEIIILFVVMVGILVVSGCTTTTTTTPSAPTPAPAPVVTNNTPNTTNNYYTNNSTTNTQNGRNQNYNPQYPNNSPATVNINIQNYAFNPASITIPVGDTIRWTNMDSVQHEVRGNIFDSGVMSPNSSFEFTFTQAGTYNYACAIHPSMQGQIIVQ
jgi:plastocyanin